MPQGWRVLEAVVLFSKCVFCHVRLNQNMTGRSGEVGDGWETELREVTQCRFGGRGRKWLMQPTVQITQILMSVQTEKEAETG